MCYYLSSLYLSSSRASLSYIFVVLSSLYTFYFPYFLKMLSCLVWYSNSFSRSNFLWSYTTLSVLCRHYRFCKTFFYVMVSSSRLFFCSRLHRKFSALVLASPILSSYYCLKMLYLPIYSWIKGEKPSGRRSFSQVWLFASWFSRSGGGLRWGYRGRSCTVPRWALWARPGVCWGWCRSWRRVLRAWMGEGVLDSSGNGVKSS